MKYCLNYINPKYDFKLVDDFDEITIAFKPSDKSLIEFMTQRSDKRFNIYIRDAQDFTENNRIELFDAIKDEHPELNFVFKFKDYHDEQVQKALEIVRADGHAIPYFFNTQANNFDTFQGLINQKPSDIYVVEILGFNIKTCGTIAHENNIRVRIFPNAAQSAWNETTGIMKFWVRPEDIPTYEDYVDVCEFYGSPEKVGTYFKIYKDGKWFGDLNEIIISLNQHLDSRCLLPQFAERRLDCGKKCLKGSKCQVCAASFALANALSENHVTIKQLTSKRRAKPIKAAN